MRKDKPPLLVLLLLVFCLDAKTACFPQVSVGEAIRSEEILEKEVILRKKLQQEEKVYIKRISVEGAGLLSEEEIEAIVSPFQKHWLTKIEIKQILTLITQVYGLKSPSGEPAKISYQIKGKELKIEVKAVTP